ncbi:PREDICTED: arylphorin subunit alpha-like [Ceratosolen solmsi marchali]|uniref:Arylphorin subunit alpha-like n=1 Tax=Ceratosolen solmsi marchali TaxID=326594 RepID=A0AAJ7E3B2_9HYME|nr:PREDICTED: arylphorin subunit alpha-like [Ceratosolen solmsi marchali]XP_011506307.1 PREDICTED: arylphorin subunit alpha-like [Ceratosolen solmsi marchali]
MIGRLVLLSVLAIGWVDAQAYKHEYQNEFTADNEFLLKQKRVYQILYHFTQPEIKTELYKEGEEYNIEAHLDSYTNKEAVTEFLHHLQHGFLSHDSIFSIYYPRDIHEATHVFRLFYYAKDFDTFYKTALFCRNRLNHQLFFFTFYLAIIHRPDTSYIRLPPIYELGPYYFYNSELLQKAHHPKETGKLYQKHSAGYDTYIIPYNYSNFYLTDEYNYDQRLNYFTEDIGLNNFYFFLRTQYPSFLSGDEINLPKNSRGEAYLYIHKLLYNRYYLERLSNDLGKIEDYDYSRPFYPGFWPTLSYPNGLPFPSRPSNSYFPKTKYHQIHESKEYESRISQAVDSGIVLTKEAKTSKIYTPDGLDILGNIIEGNADSYNPQYYGSIDSLGRDILGFSGVPLTSEKLQPSALQQYTTSLRDPAFWRLYKRIFHYYSKYKFNQKPYKPEEIQFPDLQIKSVSTDKLITYFDHFDATISNGLAVSNEQEAESYLIQVRQHRLNHKPFNVYININAEKMTKAAIRIFLGPKYNVHMKEIDFTEHHNEFLELDNFVYDLSPGANAIVRNCHDFKIVGHDPEPSEIFYKRVLKALNGAEQLKLQSRILAFPERLILPRGKPEGLAFKLFVFVSPVSELKTYKLRVFGDSIIDTRPFGYPLDRPISDIDFHGPNFSLQDIFIYHKLEHDPTVVY